MSAKSKGNIYELEVLKYLEKNGWSVFRQHRKPIFIHGRMITVGADCFGCDLIAKKKGEFPLWIQVSTVENKSHKEKQMMAYPWSFNFERAQIWCRVERKKMYRIFEAPDFIEKALVSLK